MRSEAQASVAGFVDRVEAPGYRRPQRSVVATVFLSHCYGVWAERSIGARPLRLCVVSLQGLAVAEGGNHCLGATGSLTVSVAHC